MIKQHTKSNTFAKEFQQTLNKIQPHCNTYTGIKARIEQVTALTTEMCTSVNNKVKSPEDIYAL